MDSKIGLEALNAIIRACMGKRYEEPIVPPPADYEGDFFKGGLYLIKLKYILLLF